MGFFKSLGKHLAFGSDATPSSSTSYAPNISYLLNNKLQMPDYSRLLDSANAPSSVDQVREGILGKQYQNLLTQIDENTNQALGRGVGGYLRRGIIDPSSGQATSDIATTGLATIASKGAQDKDAAALGLQQSILDMQKQREQDNLANIRAYYNYLLSGLGLQNQRDLAYATSNYSTSTGGTPATQGLLGNFLQNFGSSAGGSYGTSFAGGIPVP